MFDKPARISNSAAMLGTAVHGALERYVRDVYIDMKEKPDANLLRIYLVVSFMDTFGHADEHDPLFVEATEMCDRWFARMGDELSKITVLSVEDKQFFDLKTSAGTIRFNYIFDRLDELEEGVYRVVDYKSSVWNVTNDELKKKIQARVYGLAVNMMFPNAKRIWVQFDMLRHERVGVTFLPEENRATYRYLKGVAERIIATDEDDAPETLNPECRFCVRVASCSSVASNTTAGGHLLMPLPKMVDHYARLRAQRDALNEALKRLEGVINEEAKEGNWREAEGVEARIRYTTRRVRAVDADRVSRMVPKSVWDKYGSSSITLKDFDMMLKDPALSPQDKAALRGMIVQKVSAPSLKAEFKNAEDDD